MQSGFLRKPDCIFVWFIDGDTIMNYNIRDVRNNPTQYSHIVGLSSHFYAHIGGGSKGLSPTYEQAHMGLDLLSLASYDTGEKENVNERVGTK